MGHSESTINAYPDKISSRHRTLMRLLISGRTLSQACEELGYTVARASVIVNSPLFKEEKDKMEKELGKGFVEAEAGKLSADPTKVALNDAKEIAVKTLKGALSDPSGTVRVSAAKDILDRTGYAKEDKIKANVMVEPSQSLLDMLVRVMGNKNGSSNATADTGSKESPAK